MTAKELAEAIFGPGGYLQLVNKHCLALIAMGLVERRGRGGRGSRRDPYRYHPVSRCEQEGQDAGARGG